MLNFQFKNIVTKLIIVLIIILGITFIKQFYFIVEPGEIGMIVRLGNLQDKVYYDGFHLKIPFIERSKTMNIQTQKIEKQTAAASKDLQTVRTTLVLNYRLEGEKVLELYKTIGTIGVIENKITQPAIEESVKAANALFNAEQLITKRQEVSEKMKEILKKKLEKVGVIIVDINIIDFQFSPEFDKAIEEKVKAEQDALAEKNRLEKIKYQAQQEIETAKGSSEAKLLQAKADAEAIKIKTEAIKAQGGAEYVKLKWIDKRDGKLPITNMGTDIPVIMNLGK